MKSTFLAAVICSLVLIAPARGRGQEPPAQPAPVAQPVEPAQPAEPGQPAQPAAPAQPAQPPAPPTPAAAPPAAPAPAPLTAVMGKFSATLYGFVELDAIADSTQSFNDLAGNANIAHAGSYAAEHPRLIFGGRNSRIGLKMKGPDMPGLATSAQLEMDFLGNQPAVSEAAFIANPTFRFRHFNLKLETPYVDVLLGQYWQLFGWQSYFHPSTVAIQGVPGQIYSRSPQIRLSHAFKQDPVTVEVAVAASRPPQRNSATPDGQFGLRAQLNQWKGVHSMGSTGTAIDSLALGVSAVVRRFDLPEFSATPKNDVSRNGWGISIDALLPVLPAHGNQRGNALTLNGSVVTGAGIADLYTGLTGGVSFPALPNPGMVMPAPVYTPDVDNGLIVFDANGELHTIQWTSVLFGVQYYLPPDGKIFVSSNYSFMQSDNAAANGRAAAVFKESKWADGNLFFDLNAAVRLGLEYSWFNQTYADGTDTTNHRVQLSGFYIF